MPRIIRTIQWTFGAALTLALLPTVTAQEAEHRLIIKTQKPGSKVVSAVIVSPDGKTLATSARAALANVRYLHLAGPRSLIGVRVTALTPELREHFGVPSEAGVMVSKVIEDSAAERAGVEVADIITRADSDTIESSTDLSRVVRRKDVGEEVALELYRDGRLREIVILVEESNQPIIEILADPRITSHRRVMALPRANWHGVELAGELHDLVEVEGFAEVRAVLEHLGVYFSSDEWKERLENIEKMDFHTVEERMKEVETRLRQLEIELQKEQDAN
jgi:membrane-associated protease RseP (regulator of RpoE activity)